MIKDMTIINYEGKIFEIFVSEKNLYIRQGGDIREISDDVLNFDVEYFDKKIWISFYNSKYYIYIVEISAENNINIYKHLAVKSTDFTHSIDTLNIIIKSSEQIILTFRGWDKYKEKSNIFYNNISLVKNLNVVSSTDCNSYSSSYSSYNKNGKAYIFICKRYDTGEYILFDLIKGKTISKVIMPKSCNISLINYKDNPVVFYNKLAEKDLILKYRTLQIKDQGFTLGKEEDVYLPQNIIKPQISAFKGIVYVIWYGNKIVNIATSKDLTEWTTTQSRKKRDVIFIKTKIIEILNGNIEKGSTYIESSFIGKTDNNILQREQYDFLGDDNNSLLKRKNEEKELIGKINGLNKKIALLSHYNSRCANYQKQIENLQKIIEEKDEIIYKLLQQN